MTEISQWAQKAERGVEAPRALTPKEEAELWRQFSKALEGAGLSPEAYRARYEPLIDPAMPYEDNLDLILDEAKRIMAEASLKKDDIKVGNRLGKPFSWKHVGWGWGSLRLSLEA